MPTKKKLKPTEYSKDRKKAYIERYGELGWYEHVTKSEKKKGN